MSDSILSVGIIGDGFMQPRFFEKALRERMPERKFDIRSMYLDWPLKLKSTKDDPRLPISEFLGRPEDSTACPLSIQPGEQHHEQQRLVDRPRDRHPHCSSAAKSDVRRTDPCPI